MRASPRWTTLARRGSGPAPCGGTTTMDCRVPRAWGPLGPRTRQQIAAGVGVAPLHGDRGTLRGRRPMWGGRAPVRTVCSRGTLVATRSNPQSNVFDERLLAAGNVKKVALTACRHKLLTMLKALLTPRTPW